MRQTQLRLWLFPMTKRISSTMIAVRHLSDDQLTIWQKADYIPRNSEVMFTGIVTAILARLPKCRKEGGGARVRNRYPLGIVRPLILVPLLPVAGVCLTVVERSNNHFSVDVSEESLAVTSLKYWQARPQSEP